MEPVSTNPLTGMQVVDPSLLDIPALLISISHFPATARPQSGLSFSPFVYEFYITEGATRFLAALYGEWPAPEVPVHGGCEMRTGPFKSDGILLGNRVWLDEDADGLQDVGEGGVIGACVHLYDATGNLIATTSSDSNGFYGFGVSPGHYTLEFVLPEGLAFTRARAGPEELDSDASTSNGGVDVEVASQDLSVDAGFIREETATKPTGESATAPLAQVGPIRSGRLMYRYLADSFPGSCLIFAYASPEVLEKLPQCKVVFHQILGGGYMLDLGELWSVAKENQRHFRANIDYAGYLFTDKPSPEGRPAPGLDVYIAYQNQSGWYYDPLSQSYLRYVDTSEAELAGILHPETDRLTGRQLSVQNVIVVFAKHDVISPTNLDIRLDPGRTGKAILFRDGQALNIDWGMPRASGDGTGHPIQFLQKNGELAALRPGHTWVIVVTPETTVEQTADGRWKLIFAPPDGAK